MCEPMRTVLTKRLKNHRLRPHRTDEGLRLTPLQVQSGVAEMRTDAARLESHGCDKTAPFPFPPEG